MPKHKFGGAWTEVKLDAVQYYLQCYTNALRKVASFDLWYVDAFAGSGTRTVENEQGGIFEGRPVERTTETLEGSALRALSIEPAFHHFVFIEQNQERCAALENIRASHGGKDIRILSGDANKELRAMAAAAPWSQKDKGSGRAVVFLDPYALQVDWGTLEALAATKVMDVWYLFPLRDVVRQLARDFRGIGPKGPMLDRVLGSQWRQLYRERRPDEAKQLNFLDDHEGLNRDGDAAAIERWFRDRLGSIFCYVSEPLPIFRTPSRQSFSLFLGVSNPSPAATKLAKHFATYATSGRTPQASRRTSFP